MKKRNMFRGAKAFIFKRAERLRRNGTPAEQLLWKQLKCRQLIGLKFRRQHPINKYIVDLYCHKEKLIIELDGSVHEEGTQKEYDKEREKILIDMGFRVIRFKNEEVFRDVDLVKKKILGALKK